MGGGLFGTTVVNYQSLLSNCFPLAPQIISFSIKYRRNRLLLQSFIELPVLYFTIYQLVNKRSEILAIAISHMAHICNLYNHVFALLISMPRFNSINFYQNGPKIKIFFLKKYKIFERCASGGWGLCP